jgi:hypothetical protein
MTKGFAPKVSGHHQIFCALHYFVHENLSEELNSDSYWFCSYEYQEVLRQDIGSSEDLSALQDNK